jgi:Predicted hydrolases or acyltransferases (alpha/beta hydrolase superfamily)
MATPHRYAIIETSHGAIALEDRGQGDVPLVMIHGNSFSREAFRYQMDSPLAERYRLIALDLPGHGESANAINPSRTYTREGYADAVHELLATMGLTRVRLLGWSLGGHIAIEMAARFPGIEGVVITGTPPVPNGGFALGFHFRPESALAGQEHWTEEEADRFGHGILGRHLTPSLREALYRADGAARRILFEGVRSGVGIDQKQAVETMTIPLAVINGAEDPAIKLDYLDTLSYGSLWGGSCLRIDGAGHAPFLDAPTPFNAVLSRFMATA